MTIRAIVVDDDKETLNLFCDLLTSHKIKVVGRIQWARSSISISKIKTRCDFS